MKADAADTRRVLALVAAVTAAKLWLAARFYGFLSGDDLEIVQAAAKYALGLEYAPWSLRCLFHPAALVAPILEIAAAFGAAESPLTIAWLACLPTILASSATIWLTFRLSLRLGLESRTGALAAFFYAFHWLPLGYGSTQYARPISTMCFVLALLLALNERRRWVFAGGLLIGAAFAVRFSEGLLALPFLAVVWWKHRRGSTMALAMAGGLAGGLLFAGLTDWLTWGRPLASLAEFVQIMSVQTPSEFPRNAKPWFWYGSSVLQWAGPAAVLLLIVAVRRAGARIPFAVLGLIVFGYSLFTYKTYRYVQAAIPMVAILSAIGCAHLLSARPRALRAAGWALLALAPLWGIERTITLLRQKSRAAVDAALAMKEREPRRVLLEQPWAYGGSLTFGNGVEIRDVEPRHPLGLAGVSLEAVDAAAFYERDLADSDLQALESAGFREVLRTEARPKAVVVFQRRH